ncbi:MAG: regulatory protein RecX [Acidiferrobacterales bacterium]
MTTARQTAGVAPDLTHARQTALDMLARREHSGKELQAKLRAKGYPEGLTGEVVAALTREGLASDERFAEALVNVRRARGYGPLRIRHELEQRGVSLELIDRWLEVSGAEWIEQVRRVREKKFGRQQPEEFAERARQMRFLQQRGYTHAQITRAMNADDLD